MITYLYKSSCFSTPSFEEFKLFHNNSIKAFKNAKLHSINSPAIRWNNGNFEYFKDGLRHREDGPAAKWSNGKEEWFYKGIKIEADSLSEFKEAVASLPSKR